jgi:hypothetical protein
MFIRVNLRCAHQVRPPPGQVERNAAVRKPLATRYLFERLSTFPLWAIKTLPSSRKESASSTVVWIVNVAVAQS